MRTVVFSINDNTGLQIHSIQIDDISDFKLSSNFRRISQSIRSAQDGHDINANTQKSCLQNEQRNSSRSTVGICLFECTHSQNVQNEKNFSLLLDLNINLIIGIIHEHSQMFCLHQHHIKIGIGQAQSKFDVLHECPVHAGFEF
jgi:hypothetical protein